MPTINMRYEAAEKRVHRMKLFEATKPSPTNQKPRNSKVAIKDIRTDFQFIETPVTEDPGDEILQQENPSLSWPVVFYVLFLSALKHCAHMKAENLKLKQENIKLKATVSELRNYVQFKDIVKNNNDVNFHTGVPTLGLFNKLHNLIAPYVNRRWTGAKSALKTLRSYNHHTKFGPTRKLGSQVELLMVLMKLRLGLLDKELAIIFKISETLFSRIFLAWLRAASVVLLPMAFVSREEELMSSKPQRFKSLPCLHSIIDSTGLFIETPKDQSLSTECDMA